MSFTAKSIIFDIADNWGDSGWVGIRSIEFKLSGSLISISESDITCYATTFTNSSFRPALAFMTSLTKTGSNVNTCWMSLYPNKNNQRLICVFDSEITFDSIVINNHHSFGSATNRGAKNVKIHISDDTITDTTYDADISSSALIYDGVFDEHVSSDVSDDQILSLIVVVVLDDFSIVVDQDNITFSGGKAILNLDDFEIVVSHDNMEFTGGIQTVALTNFDLVCTFSVDNSVIVDNFNIGIHFSIDEEHITFNNDDAIAKFYFVMVDEINGYDRIEIPIASFQSRKRNDAPTYLSVTIPNLDYVDQITERQNGDMIIEQAYYINGVQKQREPIIEATLTQVDVNKTSTSNSVVLTGSTIRIFDSKTLFIPLSEVAYSSVSNGKKTYRLVKPNIYLQPGDHVTIGDDSFLCGVVTYAVSNNVKIVDVESQT